MNFMDDITKTPILNPAATQNPTAEPKRIRTERNKNELAKMSRPNLEQMELLPKFDSDGKLLDEVISRVHRAITSGELELKIEHAFKAIEIKQKLAENGQVENLLLELLNEIRRQELGRKEKKSLAIKRPA